jgi:short-subunit dehydrogenase
VTKEVALIVGNSDGIGLALTRLLLSRGYRVAGISRSPSPIQHERYCHVVLDVTAPNYIQELRCTLDRVGNVDHVVYCAGIGVRLAPEALERDLAVFDVNLSGAIKTAQILIPAMLRAASGRFIVLSSQADCIVSEESTSYPASKAALSSYFEGLGLKLRATKVRICNVRFGFVDTKMARAGVQPFRISAEQAANKLLRLLEGRCPLRVTYPRRMAIVVAAIAAVQRLRVALRV